MAALAEDPNFHLSLQLQPGDIEWIHNPTTFHARTDVIDGVVSAHAFMSCWHSMPYTNELMTAAVLRHSNACSSACRCTSSTLWTAKSW